MATHNYSIYDQIMFKAQMYKFCHFITSLLLHNIMHIGIKDDLLRGNGEVWLTKRSSIFYSFSIDRFLPRMFIYHESLFKMTQWL